MPYGDGTGPNGTGPIGWGRGPCGRGGARRAGGGPGRGPGLGRRGLFQSPQEAGPDRTAELEARITELENRLGGQKDQGK